MYKKENNKEVINPLNTHTKESINATIPKIVTITDALH